MDQSISLLVFSQCIAEPAGGGFFLGVPALLGIADRSFLRVGPYFDDYSHATDKRNSQEKHGL